MKVSQHAKHKENYKKTCIHETLNLLTCADKAPIPKKPTKLNLFYIISLLLSVMCHKSPTPTATATYPSPSNSPTLHYALYPRKSSKKNSKPKKSSKKKKKRGVLSFSILVIHSKTGSPKFMQFRVPTRGQIYK